MTPRRTRPSGQLSFHTGRRAYEQELVRSYDDREAEKRPVRDGLLRRAARDVGGRQVYPSPIPVTLLACEQAPAQQAGALQGVLTQHLSGDPGFLAQAIEQMRRLMPGAGERGGTAGIR